MKQARIYYRNGEQYVSVSDLKEFLNDDERITLAAHVAKVGWEEHRADGSVEIMRRAIASFFMHAITGE